MAKMNRREFLAKNTTAALALYLSGCTTTKLAGADKSLPAGRGLTKKDVDAAYSDLTKLVKGSVLKAGDPAYQSAILIDNGRVKRAPFLVVQPSSTQDIASTVKYCRVHELRLTTKAGGHSAAGYCLNAEGIVLDLSKMNTIQPLNGGNGLAIGTGTRWIQVYDYAAQNHDDRIPIGGGCAGVGVAGFLLGGGYSFVSRSYGMGCDNVSAMEFVSADGNIYELNDELKDPNERDLYWALRGAGGGNFGIVSRIDLKLHKRRTPTMTMGSITFPFERAAEVLHFYNKWVLTLPKEMAVYGMIRSVSDPANGGAPRVCLRLNPFYNGSASEALKLIKPLLALGPTSAESYNLTLPQWESFMGTGTAINGRSAYIRSTVFAPKGLTSEVVGILTKYMNQSPSRDSFIVWTHGGGKIRSPHGTPNCYPHRDAEFVFELKSVWEANAPEKREGIDWAVKFLDELGSHSIGAYANYIDPLLENWQHQYYRDSYKRLLDVKTRWDREGFFNFQQGIGSSFSPNRSLPLDISPLTKT